AKAGTLGSCRTPIERYIASKWGSRRAHRPAIDARSLNPDKYHPIPGGVAAAKGIIQSGEVEHGPAIAALVSQIECAATTMSENDRCWTVATQQLSGAGAVDRLLTFPGQAAGVHQQPSFSGEILAAVSMALWLSVLVAGRWIGFV